MAQADFLEHCRICTRDLRDALTALYREMKADISRPQEVSRQFKLNKNLTWKIAKIFQTTDPVEAVPLIPGAEGMEILLTAMSNGGARAETVHTVRERLQDFERMVETHVGDRATLELLMDGLSRGGKALELSRKLAFRGNSGIWGLQARVRSLTQVLAPNPENPSMLDMATVGGLHDVRRLRSVQGWPIFRFHGYGVGGADMGRQHPMSPLETPAHDDEPYLIMRSFCDPPEAEVRSIVGEVDVSHELVDGPIGRMGEMTFVFGAFERGRFARFAAKVAAEEEFGEMSALVTMPVEAVHFDVLVHRSMLDGFEPELVVYGRPFGSSGLNHATRENFRLPIEERVVRIEPGRDGLQRFQSDMLPDHPRLLEHVMARCKWDEREFTGFRAVVPYPPMPSTVMMRYVLPRA